MGHFRCLPGQQTRGLPTATRKLGFLRHAFLDHLFDLLPRPGCETLHLWRRARWTRRHKNVINILLDLPVAHLRDLLNFEGLRYHPERMSEPRSLKKINREDMVEKN